MHPISNMKRMARFGALFGAMTLVTACSSALDGPKDRKDRATTHTQDGDESGSVITISTSAPAWPSDPPPFPSNPDPSSGGTSTGGGGGDPSPTLGCADYAHQFFTDDEGQPGYTEDDAREAACATAIQEASGDCKKTEGYYCKAVSTEVIADRVTHCSPSRYGGFNCTCNVKIECSYVSPLPF